MKTLILLFVLVIGLITQATLSGQANQTVSFQIPELIYAWTQMEYDFPTAAEAQFYTTNQIYKKACLAGVDVDRKGNVYVTTPRWLDSRIPATLNLIVKINDKPVLRPFPDWTSNKVGEAKAFQNVLGVDIDSQNRMWIVDMGWVAGIDQIPDGAQKIVVLDLNTGTKLKRYEIPDTVANRNTSFLNDIVVDEKREIAYITDSGNRSGSPTASGIIIYDFKTNTARRVLDKHPSVQDDPTRTLVVGGETVFPNSRVAIGVNGIALSPDGDRLYWSITTGDGIYSAPTDILLHPTATTEEISAAMSGPRRIGGGSDGISMDNKGRIYITNLAQNKVQVWDSSTDTLETIAEGQNCIWPDSLSWDDKGGLYFSTNCLHHAFAGIMNFEQTTPNFRIFRIQTDAGKAFVK